jgi:hypothetical protein
LVAVEADNAVETSVAVLNAGIVFHTVTVPLDWLTAVPVPAVKVLTPIPPATDCDITAVATSVDVLND